MNLDSRKGGVRASRFYALMFVALTGILGMVSPPDLVLMTAQAQTTQDLNAEAVSLFNQGQKFLKSNQYQKAIDYFQQSLAIFRQLGNTEIEPVLLYAIGANYVLLGDIQKGREPLRQSVEIAKKIGDRKTEEQATDLLNKISPPDPASTNQSLKKAEASRLMQQGKQQSQISQFEVAMQSWQQALTIYREIKDRQGEGESLWNLGNAYDSLGKYDKAIESYMQSLEIAREIKDRQGEGASLWNLGKAYFSLGKYDSNQYQKAIDYFQQSLVIFRQLGNTKIEPVLLYAIGSNYVLLGDIQKGREPLRQSVELAKKIGDRETEKQATDLLNKISPPDPASTNQSLKKAEASRLMQQGKQQSQISQVEAAMQSWQQALTIYREIKDRQGEGNSLGNLGGAYYFLGKYDKAIEFFLQHLEIAREIKDRSGEGAALGNLGLTYDSLGKYDKAIEFQLQSLEIARETKDRLGEGNSLRNLGIAYYSLGKYDKAIEFQLQSLEIAREIKDRLGEGQSLGNLGNAYYFLGKYDKAIEFQLQSLEISREIKDRLGEGNALGNLGNAYQSLGKYDKAIEFQLQSLAIAREIKDRLGEGNSLGSLGDAYYSLGKYDKAIEFQLQSLAIAREIKDRKSEGNSLTSLGGAYYSLGKYDKAIEFQLQSLAIAREIKDRRSEGAALNNLAAAYGKLSRDREAMISYQQALTIAREISDRYGVGLALSNLGNVLSRAKRPELAILFYKQSINVREAIRKDINKLDKDLQKSYLNTVESSYRRLADLLLKQGRIMEALQVLDLLKVQELQDFFKDVKGNEKTAQGIELLNEEKEFWQSFSKQNIDLTTANTPQILQQLRQTAPAQNLQLAAYKDLQTRIQKLGSNSALLYPLILEDRLELVLFVPNAPPISRTVPVKQTELIKVAEQFREDIQKPNSLAVLDPANKLYNWMIEPIANDLKQANITTIIYAPDGVMRHVPLAALYDGKQWLVEKYRINYITALSLTDIDPQIQQAPRILAGAFTDRSGTVKIGDNNISFSSLPAALPEVENLVANFPNTTKLVDKDFNRKAIASDKLNQYNIIHFATHAHLVAGSPEDSFVLLNNNEYVTLRQVKDWKLPNVGLAVFSACQTALGGKLSSGIEIIGFGYQLQQAQARASIATLWEISDGGTQALMGKFYERMKLTSSSAEALQQAQIDLIRSNGKSTDEKRAGVRITWQGIKPEVESQLNHPYYWAPFILIGNGF